MQISINKYDSTNNFVMQYDFTNNETNLLNIKYQTLDTKGRKIAGFLGDIIIEYNYNEKGLITKELVRESDYVFSEKIYKYNDKERLSNIEFPKSGEYNYSKIDYYINYVN